MNLLDTATASPLEQALYLKNQNKEQVIAFINGIISSLEKTDYSRFPSNEIIETQRRTLDHINYWRAVKGEILKGETPKTEVPKTETPKTETTKIELPKPGYIKSKNVK
jgi:hypothetical protein